MGTNLMDASEQWASRPQDQRFENVPDAHDFSVRSERTIFNRTEDYAQAEAVDLGNNVALLIPGVGEPAQFTNWSFGQFCKKAGAPASYLSTLKPALAAQCLNEGMRNREGDAGLFSFSRTDEGALTLRASLSDEYGSIPDSAVWKRVQTLIERGWRVPVARPAPGVFDPRVRLATAEDVSAIAARSPLSVKVGDPIAPAGLYASDRDMFALLCDETRPVNNPADRTHPLFRFLMVWNSTVGARSLGIITGLYDVICGNHIIWGATEVNEFRTYHRGSDAERRAFARMAEVAMQYSESSAQGIEASMQAAQQRLIAPTLEEIPDLVAAKKQLAPILSKRLVKEAIEVAVNSDRYGDPRSPWALSQGLTELSQRLPNTDSRTEIDRAAGRILDLF